jgi:LacI family repressor for deo operon, udp, cdd, tsx, nupC, and nupG
MAATIRDVARLADLSTATISRVLNNPSAVLPSTRERVEHAIAELNYRPPTIAREWTKRNLRTIGVLIPDITNLYYPTVVKALENELWKNDFNIYLCNTDESIERENRYISSLVRKGVEGMIFLGTRPISAANQHIAKLSESIPVLLVNDHIIGSNVYSIMADEVEGAYKAVSYLAKLGHRKIGFLNGSAEYTTYQYKRTGYERALIQHGIEAKPEWIVEQDPHEEGGYIGAQTLLKLRDRPTAIFAASDQIAVGAIRACFDEHLRIPNDISLMGFSNVPIAASLCPPLTTVDQFPVKTAEIAAEMIVRLIRKEKLSQKRVILEPQIEVRASCATLC